MNLRLVGVYVEAMEGRSAEELETFAEKAVVEQKSVVRRIARNLGLALVIVAISALAGSLVRRLKTDGIG